MLDWLKRDPREASQIELADRTLPVVIRRLAHARRLTLRLSPDGSEARVTMPRWGSTAGALPGCKARSPPCRNLPRQPEAGCLPFAAGC